MPVTKLTCQLQLGTCFRQATHALDTQHLRRGCYTARQPVTVRGILHHPRHDRHSRVQAQQQLPERQLKTLELQNNPIVQASLVAGMLATAAEDAEPTEYVEAVFEGEQPGAQLQGDQEQLPIEVKVRSSCAYVTEGRAQYVL